MSDKEMISTLSRLLEAKMRENGEGCSVVGGDVLHDRIICRFNNPIMVSMTTCQKIKSLTRAKHYERWPGEVTFYWR